MALECEALALALHYEALALSTSGLVLLGLGLGLDTVGLVNITAIHWYTGFSVVGGAHPMSCT